MLIVLYPEFPDTDSGINSQNEQDERLDNMDLYNHPRKRRQLILNELKKYNKDVIVKLESITTGIENIKDVYGIVHTDDLLEFLQTAWTKWIHLGENGRETIANLHTSNNNETKTPQPFRPINVPLPRFQYQCQSKHVLGQIGYYCTDTCTPIFDNLLLELQYDAAIVQTTINNIIINNNNDNNSNVYYLLTTHPGHHAATDSFGGYCYVNHAATIAKAISNSNNNNKVAILDIDYHCGNGTAEIFDTDPNIFVVSIHCDPNYDYPFHSGFNDEVGHDEGIGTTLHIPLPPQITDWDNTYKPALIRAMDAIKNYFGGGNDNINTSLIISLGLDTYKNDPCAIRRAGFILENDDYKEMGKLIAKYITKTKTTTTNNVIFVQEGGYRMDKIGHAACDVVISFTNEYQK